MKTLIVLTALLASSNALASGGPRFPGAEACENLDGLFPVMVVTDEAEPDAVLIKYLFAKCQQAGATLEKISFGEQPGRSATGICKTTSSKQ